MLVGTTPTHIFNVPLSASEIAEVRVLYSQNDKLLVTKTTDDCTIQDEQISVTLTQEDTFLFDADKFVEIQIRVLTPGGNALGSIPETVGLTKCLSTEVIE